MRYMLGMRFLCFGGRCSVIGCCNFVGGSSRHWTLKRAQCFGHFHTFPPERQLCPNTDHSTPDMSSDAKGNWAKTSVEEWRDAVYHPGSFFEELTRDTIAYVKQSAIANGINPAETALIEVGAGTGDILFALGDTFEKLVGVDINSCFMEWCEKVLPAHLKDKTDLITGNACSLTDLLTTQCPDWTPGKKSIAMCVGNTLGIMPMEIKPLVLDQMMEVGDNGLVIVVFWNGNRFGSAVQHFYSKHPELCGDLSGAEFDWANSTMQTQHGYRTKWTKPAEAREFLESHGVEVLDVTERGVGVLCTCRKPRTAASLPTEAESTTQQYYDSDDAFTFYKHVWGGSHIHVGLYDDSEVAALSNDEDRVKLASEKSVHRLLTKVPCELGPGHRVMDMGAAYGGAARHIARTYGSSVCCIDMAQRSNEANRAINEADGLSHLVSVHERSFTNTNEPSGTFDLIVAQDAFLHAAKARKDVLPESCRLLKSGGYLVFSDIMQADNADPSVLRSVYDRIHLEDMGSVAAYRQWASDCGLEFVEFDDKSSNIAAHYRSIQAVLSKRRHDLAGAVSSSFVDKMDSGLAAWVEHGEKKHLAWGFLVFRKP